MILQHEAFVNLYNKDQQIFKDLFSEVKTLSQLNKSILNISRRFNELSYIDSDKVKGDVFEIFAEIFFKIVPFHPTKNGGYGVYNYTPVKSVDDNGVDGYGIGMDDKSLTVQVKCRLDKTLELTQKDLNQYGFQSIVNYNVDKDTKTNMIVFTNAKGLHFNTEDKVFSNRIRTIAYDDISNIVDNNNIFWKYVKDLIEETIKVRYK